MRQLKRRLVRRASRAIVGGFRPPESPCASRFGDVRVALPGESWPTGRGEPMIPLCQFNLSEAPAVPERLQDVAFLAVFLDAHSLPSNAPNGEGWLLRTYSRTDGLVPLPRPAGLASTVRPFPIRWELIEEDYPCWDDVGGLALPDGIDEDYEEQFPNRSGTKLGGWPTLIQSEIYWAPLNRHLANPEYVFQVGSEPKAGFGWGDSGVGYFGRGTGEHADVWALEWQCY